MKKPSTLVAEVLAFFYYILEGMVLALTPKKFRTFKSIEGEVVLVTGGGSGIGRLVTQRLARRGAHVVIWDLNEAGNAETVRLVKEAGGLISAYTVDVSDRVAVYATAAKVKQDVGTVRILINNAGIVNGKNLLDLQDDRLVKTFEVNTLAHFWTIKAFLPDMVADNHGHIVTVSSMAGKLGCPQMTDYCAAKFGAIGLEESLRLELLLAEKYNVFNTLVCPFFINTGLFEGVNTGPIPLLDSRYVADEIVDAILMNKEVLILPKILNLALLLRTILPYQAQIALFTILGGRDFMVNFSGRQNATKKTNDIVTNGSHVKVIAG